MGGRGGPNPLRDAGVGRARVGGRDPMARSDYPSAPGSVIKVHLASKDAWASTT